MNPKHQSQNTKMRLIGERVKKTRQLLGLSQKQLAKTARSSPGQLSMVEHNHCGTSLQTAIWLAQALDVSLDYLIGLADEPTPSQVMADDLKIKVARVRDLEEGHAEPLDPNWQEHVSIEEFNTVVGAEGMGAEEQITRRLKFPHPWLRKHGLRAHTCQIVRVAGEAMEPTVPDGCSILIDVTSTERRDGKIFVVRIRDAVLVRRALHDPEAGWLLYSDNPDKTAWPTQPWPKNTTIVGQVRWLGHTFM